MRFRSKRQRDCLLFAGRVICTFNWTTPIFALVGLSETDFFCGVAAKFESQETRRRPNCQSLDQIATTILSRVAQRSVVEFEISVLNTGLWFSG